MRTLRFSGLRTTLRRTVVRDRYLILLVAPALVYYVLFHYMPMYGALISFVEFTPGRGIFESPFVGFKHFRTFFESIFFWRLIRNTFVLSGLFIIFGFPAPVVFALILNDVRHPTHKKVFQTISYMPYFISLVVVVGIVFNLFSVTQGVVNNALDALGFDRIEFLSDPNWFRPLYVGSSVWQTYGWNSIVYLAALTSIDPTLYEAATIDGASRFQQVIHVSIPSILPMMAIILLLMIGRVMSVGFEKVILMYSPATYETGDIISSYVYRRGILGAQYSFGAAVGLFNSVVNLVILLFFNRLSRRLTEVSLW